MSVTDAEMTQLFSCPPTPPFAYPNASKIMNSECSQLTIAIHLCDRQQPRRLSRFLRAMALSLMGMWVSPSFSFSVFVIKTTLKESFNFSAALEDGGKV